MKLLLFAVSCLVFMILGFALGTEYATRKQRKMVSDFTKTLANLQRMDVLRVIREGDNGCAECHDREFSKQELKDLSSLPHKDNKKTMRVHVCESNNTEEEEGCGLVKQTEELGTAKADSKSEVAGDALSEVQGVYRAKP